MMEEKVMWQGVREMKEALPYNDKEGDMAEWSERKKEFVMM